MASEASDCLHVLVAKGYEDVFEWLSDLSRLKVISKGMQ